MSEFELKKVKLDGQKIEVIKYSDGSGEYEYYPDKNKLCHPDLVEAIEVLVPYLVDSNDLRVHRKEVKMAPAVKEAATKMEGAFKLMDELINESVTVTGISISGDENNRGVVITGKRKVHHTGVAMNSPQIKMNGDSFGFESTVDDLVEDIITEVRAYVIDGKSAQLAMDLESTDAA